MSRALPTRIDHGERPSGSEAGFTLIETMVALFVLMVGLMGLAQAFYLGMIHLSTSSANLIAREKAREAVESVHTARDTRTITWAEIRNTSAGGRFLDGAQPLNVPGDDGLVNTGDNGENVVESIREPGVDGLLGTADDVLVPLTTFTRQIEIVELVPANPDLREVRVTIGFRVGSMQRTYTLRTYVSAFS